MKKNYNQPIVESTQLMPASIVLAGSLVGIGNGGSTGDFGGGDPLPGE